MDEPSYASNSYKSKNAEKNPPEKKIEPVVSGANINKQSTGKRVMSSMIADDLSNVKSYMIFDVLIPAMKSTIADLVSNGIEMLLYGDVRGARGTRSSASYNTSRTNYNSMWNRYDNRSTSSRGGDQAIIMDTREGIDITLKADPETGRSALRVALDLLDRVDDLMYTYHEVEVSDIYDLCGLTAPYTANNWGWRSTKGISRPVQRGNECYISFPPVEKLN